MFIIIGERLTIFIHYLFPVYLAFKIITYYFQGQDYSERSCGILYQESQAMRWKITDLTFKIFVSFIPILNLIVINYLLNKMVGPIQSI